MTYKEKLENSILYCLLGASKSDYKLFEEVLEILPSACFSKKTMWMYKICKGIILREHECNQLIFVAECKRKYDSGKINKIAESVQEVISNNHSLPNNLKFYSFALIEEFYREELQKIAYGNNSSAINEQIQAELSEIDQSVIDIFDKITAMVSWCGNNYPNERITSDLNEFNTKVDIMIKKIKKVV